MSDYQKYNSLRCETLVIGGGIAGCWTALKLAESGVDTLLVFYSPNDRGGRMGSTHLSVGAINTSPILRSDYASWLDELGRGQMQTSIISTTSAYLSKEIDALKKFDELKPIELGFSLASGSGKNLVEKLLTHLRSIGVRVIDDLWVTAIEASEEICRGVHYQRGDDIGVIQAASIVIATGGYSGLFKGAVKSGTFGSLHGRFLMAGGKLSNVEFIFKHGYGQPDLGTLTPTEELPGVEIYDSAGNHVTWLEEELFYGRGTHNHFQAFMTWRKNDTTDHYVDFKYRDIHRKIKQLISFFENKETIDVNYVKESFEMLLATQEMPVFLKWLIPILLGQKAYCFNEFCYIKNLVKFNVPIDKHRIRQIAYFSMGGIMHHGFLTNLKNVYVNGEAMHDYGAHRVGGLPWSLYLTAAKKIANDIVLLKQRNQLDYYPLNNKPNYSEFDKDILAKIQEWLFSIQEQGQGETHLRALAKKLQDERRALSRLDKKTDDAFSYLLLAEAIILSSLTRQESRGCFFREDYPEENFHRRHLRTIAFYDENIDEILTDSIDKANILDLVANKGKARRQIESIKDTNNAAYFLLKKHINSPIANSTAIIHNNVSITYQELNEHVDRYAHWLFSTGLKHGDTIALCLTDSPEWIALFIAGLQMGLIVVPINTFVSEQDIVFYLNDSKASILITESRVLAGLDIQYIIDHAALRISLLDDILPLSNNKITACTPVDDYTTGFILYTSGSTGKPKGALHSHKNLRVTAENFGEELLNPRTGDRFYSSSKLFFAYGLGNSLTFPLFFGCTTVLSSGRLNPEETVKFLNDHRITHFFSIPAIYSKLLSVEAASLVPTSMRICISAGEPLPSITAMQWVEKTHVDLVDGIGSTESLHIFCVNVFDKEGNISIGKPIKNYQLQLLDENNFVIEKPNVIGNLAVKGHSIAYGYWNNKSASENVFIHDLLLTGDQYKRSDTGDYIYLGRKGDMYKSSGLWVSGVDIEQNALSLEYIESASLTFYIDAHRQQQTVLFITPSGQNKSLLGPDWAMVNVPIPLDKVRNDLSNLLSRYKMPTHIFWVDELPRTSTGKVNKESVRQMAIKKVSLMDSDNRQLPSEII